MLTEQQNNLYFNDLLPERFGRKESMLLGKSGKLILKKNLQN
jgi:D-citramalate synthase